MFLDRDGVLNEAVVVDGRPLAPASVEQFRLLPGVVEACAALHGAGFVLVVVTNQPDIARGALTHEVLDRMHDRLRALLAVDEIVVCPHDDADGCVCRKPRPGMLLDAARRLDLDLDASFCVGDRWRDVEAARRAGVRPVFVDCHYDEPEGTGAELVVEGLPEAVPWIRRMRQDEQNEYAQGEAQHA